MASSVGGGIRHGICRAALIAVAVTVGAACSGGDGRDPGSAEEAAEILAERMDVTESTAGDKPQADAVDERTFDFIDQVARCMEAEGFDFVAVIPEPSIPDGLAINETGYGIVASVLAPNPDPNEAILEQLDPLDQEAYLLALWGDPTTDDGGCAGQAMTALGDDQPDVATDDFVDRDVEELQARTIALASARPEVIDAINEAVICANEQLGDGLVDDSFDFLSVAEYRVARVLDQQQAEAGATLFDLVASSDDGRLILDERVVEEMLAAESKVRQIDLDCRGAIQPVLRQAFVDVAADLLTNDPDTTAAIVDGNP